MTVESGLRYANSSMLVLLSVFDHSKFRTYLVLSKLLLQFLICPCPPRFATNVPMLFVSFKVCQMPSSRRQFTSHFFLGRHLSSYLPYQTSFLTAHRSEMSRIQFSQIFTNANTGRLFAAARVSLRYIEKVVLHSHFFLVLVLHPSQF